MRVLLVSQHFPPDSLGGVERYTQRLAAELVKAGDTVSIVARRPVRSPKPIQTIRERLPDGTTLYRFAGGAFGVEQFLAHHERLEQLFTAAVLEAAPDVVHFNHLRSLSPRSIAIAHRLRAAVVISLHDFYFACPQVHLRKRSGELCAGPDEGRECARACFAGQGTDAAQRWGLRALYFRRLLGLADRVIAVSRYVASFFRNFAPDLTSMQVVPNGIALEPPDPALLDSSTPRERGTLNLAFCGTVAPHKGPHIILDALRGAELPAVDLLLLGEAPDRDYVRQLKERAAAIRGLKFRLYGAFKQAEVPHLLRGVDCVIVPSQVPEAGPQAPLEALACGVPVLASRIGSLPEVVADGENGFTFDPVRPRELAQLLRRLVGEENLLPRLRESVRRTRVATVAEHSRAVRGVYQEAVTDLTGHQTVQGAELSEIELLHGTLLSLGVGKSE